MSNFATFFNVTYDIKTISIIKIMLNMTKKEKSLYTFLDNEKKDRYQLVQIDILGNKCICNTIYQIRKNRRIITTFNGEYTIYSAIKKFYLITGSEILQTKLYEI